MNDNLPSVTVLIAARPEQAEIKAVAAGRASWIIRPDQLEILVARGKQPSVQRNAALKAARGELIYFLDDDSVPQPDNLRRAVAHFRDPQVQDGRRPESVPAGRARAGTGFCAGDGQLACVWAEPRPLRRRRRVRATSEKELILCNLVARRDTMLELGGFNESLYPNEENALMDELQKRGGKLIYDPQFIVHRRPRSQLEGIRKNADDLRAGQGGAVSGDTRRSAPRSTSCRRCFAFICSRCLSWRSRPASAELSALMPLAFYGLVLLAQAAALAPRGGVLRSLCAIPLMALTHLLYGMGFWRGLFTKLKPPGKTPPRRSSSETCRARPPTGAMKNPLWAKAIKACADPPRAKHFLDLLARDCRRADAGELFRGANPRPDGVVQRLAGSGQSACAPIPTGWRRSTADASGIRVASKVAQRGERWLKPLLEARDYAGALGRLRRFKQREMLRIAARDLARLANALEIIARNLGRGGCVPGHALPDLPAAIDRAVRPAVFPGRGRTLAAERNFVCSAWASSAGRN